ncbi:MAG: 3-deoxy-7-phosphoheptulonate synthase [Myxococcales bacterium]|nr:3-deoxy-7-phosphoheptulonate synthase [Myxococcales bacterium]
MSSATDDVRILQLKPLIPPQILMEELPATEEIATAVRQWRSTVDDIVKQKDDRLLVVVGPCSVHDPGAAVEYARLLKACAERLQDDLFIVMRVYFEKPRTTVGWKGLINDPYLDGTFRINEGLRIARNLVLTISQLGVPVGTEFLDTISPQFIADLVAWGAIGARTTESQIHRELASGLSMAVGFKNSTGGDVAIAVDAIRAARAPHHFLSVTKQGISAIVATKGNDACHVILRGGASGPNYSADHLSILEKHLDSAEISTGIMVDCSHANSQKDHSRQPIVAGDLAEQVTKGNQALVGTMLESHLVAGRQNLTRPEDLRYGQSITDACLGWEDTVPVLEQLAAAVRQRRTHSS